MKTINIIPKGTSVCPTEKGHNNFYYPKLSKCTILTEDIKVQALHWAGGGSLSAFKVVGQTNIVWTERKYVTETNS